MPRPSGHDAARVIGILGTRYAAKADMDLGNPKDTLLGVLLTARTTDKQVLKIFPAFKKRFPTFASLAKTTPDEIGKSISTIGLYKSKAKAIHGLSQIILKKHHGKVPGTFDDLVELPGVGRKTANCVLSHVFGQDTVCVDTHVFRIAHRLGWSKGKTPEAVERDLMKLVPQTSWQEINRTFVQFGRDICTGGKKPACWKCPVSKWCAYPHKTPKPTA